MLFDKIGQNSYKIGFHTPGYIPGNDFFGCDVTELSYTDNLLRPSGDIKILEENLASVYRADKVFISTQGASFNVFQAVDVIKNHGAVLVIGKAHISVYNALRHFGIKTYICENFNADDDIPSDAGSVVITSPDYFGRVLPLPEIYEFFHKRNVLSVVDSAHGAHFIFSSKLPVSASEYADMGILSLHKTLPVITGGSIIASKDEFAERLAFSRRTTHSTSPNFMTICSMEKMLGDFAENGEKYYSEIKSKVDEFEKNLPPPFSLLKNDDFSRVVILSPYTGLGKYLEDRGFVPETEVANGVVLIVTRFNADYLPLLNEALRNIPVLSPFDEEKAAFSFENGYRVRRNADKFRLLPLVGYREGQYVKLSDAVGRRPCEDIGFYPPAHPYIFAGEKILPEDLPLLSADNVFGIKDGFVKVW